MFQFSLPSFFDNRHLFYHRRRNIVEDTSEPERISSDSPVFSFPALEMCENQADGNDCCHIFALCWASHFFSCARKCFSWVTSAGNRGIVDAKLSTLGQSTAISGFTLLSPIFVERRGKEAKVHLRSGWMEAVKFWDLHASPKQAESSTQVQKGNGFLFRQRDLTS